jgi:predicted phosphate transport protein (TIGR00153 family)
MGLREWIVPQERYFFDLLEQDAAAVEDGARALLDLMTDFRDVPSKVKHIKDIEHRGDEVVHTIYEELNKTFITPIDREDIMALASDLDNVLDMIDAAANRLLLYEVEMPSRAMVDLAEVIVEATTALRKAVGMIRNMKQAAKVEAIAVEVNRLENVADDLMNTSVAALFRETDVIHIIKCKEIIERLEEATDYCEDVANVLSDIVAKNQ